tara:strand:+ start:444 stop:1442 length:999 start_codon:yes stop_codon:yes gene_type:complete
MRFYNLTITLLLLALNLSAQTSDAIELSSEQIALIQSQGAEGVQTVLSELGIQIQDLEQIEEFASEAVSRQINESSNTEMISEVTSGITASIAEIALANSVEPSYAIEYVSAGAAHGLMKSNFTNMPRAIQALSKGTMLGAIQFSKSNEFDILKSSSAAASGSLAGVIEASNDLGFGIIRNVKASSSGLVIGTIISAKELNSAVFETLTATTEGIAEAAIEASVKVDIDLIPQITSASLGAGENTVRAATALNLSKRNTIEAIKEGLRKGSAKSLPGEGSNIRITINPIEDIDLVEVVEAFEAFEASSPGTTPIIETPFMDDPTIRQVSPTT